MEGYSSTTTTNPSPYFQSQFQSQYNNALQRNDSNYQNILSNYNQNQQNVAGVIGGVSQGYGNLNKQVQGTIAGVGASQSQAIHDQYAAQAGSVRQQTINSGLGNTTVASQLQRAPMLDAQKAQVALSNQMAQLQAGYQSQLGGAGLQAQMAGAGLQSQMGNVLGGNLASYRTPYPGYPPTGQTTTSQGMGVPGLGGGSRGGGMGGSNGLWSGGQPGGGGSGSGYYPAQGINPNTMFPGQQGGGYASTYGAAYNPLNSNDPNFVGPQDSMYDPYQLGSQGDSASPGADAGSYFGGE